MLHPDITREDCPDNLKEAWERQQRSANAILERYAGGMDTVLLADDVGTGKTYTALAVAAHTLLTDPKARIVLVTPPGLVSKWEQEIHSFNAQYIRRQEGSEVVLRPRVIDTYWDMVSLLHEYDDRERQRISANTHACLLRVFCQWCDKTMKPGRGSCRMLSLPGIGCAAEDSPEFLHFCSSFSPRSLEFFFSRQHRLHPQAMKARVTAVREGRSEEALNALFKDFCRQQQEYAPNIFILRMSGLRLGRADDIRSRLLNTWLALRLLAGLRAEKNENGLRSLFRWAYVPSGMCRGDAKHRAWLDDLAKCDMWGLRDVPFPKEAATARESLIAQTDNQGEQLKNIQFALIKEKMLHAGFALGIVDEAHNWKGGKNGAGSFKRNYAPYIPKTLLLTATPFQLHPQELKVLIQCVVGNEESPSRTLVEKLTKPDGLFDKSLRASKHFECAWKALPPDCGAWLRHAFETPRPTDTIISALPELPDAPTEMALFAEAAMQLHNNVLDLRNDLIQLMIRHSKSRNSRQFHAGCDYAPSGAPASAPRRTGLYEVAGYGSEEDAFISFLAMRADQLLRRESRKGSDHAHLREGLSSSFAAFLESHDKKHAAMTALPEYTKAYVDFLKKALKKTEHPKVHATVKRALYNFRNGKKTLIFCERLATQKELFEKFCQKVMKGCFPGGGLGRARRWYATILRDPLLTDWYLSRSLYCCEEVTLSTALCRRAAENAQVQAQDIRLYGKRRLARLLDLHLLQALGSSDPLADALVRLLNDPDDLKLYLGTDTDDRESKASVNFEKMAKRILSGQNIWHTGKHPRELQLLLWKLLLNEWIAPNGEEKTVHGLIPVLRALPQGLRRIVLRLDVLQKLPQREKKKGKTVGLFLTARLKRLFYRDETACRAWDNTVNFVDALLQADGALLDGASQRGNLWRGISLKQRGNTSTHKTENLFAAKLNGSVSPERRTALCAAFNAPIYPDVLFCTSIGSEGIDLHRCCAEIIHHDLTWNPARLEQRNGRIDRVGSLAEKEHYLMYFGIPFLAHDYEDYQYKMVHQRAQRMDVLLGADMPYGETSEETVTETGQNEVHEIENPPPLPTEQPCVELPEKLTDYIRIHLEAMD